MSADVDGETTGITTEHADCVSVRLVAVDPAFESVPKRLVRSVGVEWPTPYVPSASRAGQNAERSQAPPRGR